MIASAIAGIGVLAVTNLFGTTARGLYVSRSRETATQIAIQRAERLAALPLSAQPACAGVVGCRTSRTAMSAPLATVNQYRCTQQVDDMGPSDPNAPDTGIYRVDTVLARNPAGGQVGDARLLSVSVCWRDPRGNVEQILIQRLLLDDDQT